MTGNEYMLHLPSSGLYMYDLTLSMILSFSVVVSLLAGLRKTTDENKLMISQSFINTTLLCRMHNTLKRLHLVLAGLFFRRDFTYVL